MRTRTYLSKINHTDAVRDRVINTMKSIMASYPGMRSRKAFATAIGISSTTINRWESFTGNPTVEDIAVICTKFSVSPNFLILGQGNQWGDAEVMKRIELLEHRMKAAEAEILKLNHKNK